MTAGSRGKCAASTSASARGGWPTSLASVSARLVVQSPCAASRGTASSMRATRSGVWRPAWRSASARPSVSVFQTKVHLPGVAPQPLEQVVLPRLGVEDVHHHLDVVQQHPAPAAQPLDVPGGGAMLVELLLDGL